MIEHGIKILNMSKYEFEVIQRYSMTLLSYVWFHISHLLMFIGIALIMLVTNDWLLCYLPSNLIVIIFTWCLKM